MIDDLPRNTLNDVELESESIEAIPNLMNDVEVLEVDGTMFQTLEMRWRGKELFTEDGTLALIPHSPSDTWPDQALQTVFKEASKQFDLDSTAGAISFCATISEALEHETKYFRYWPHGLSALERFDDDVWAATYFPEQKDQFSPRDGETTIFFSASDAHVISLMYGKTIYAPDTEAPLWHSSVYLYYVSEESAILDRQRTDGEATIICALHLYNASDKVANVRIIGQCLVKSAEGGIVEFNCCQIPEDWDASIDAPIIADGNETLVLPPGITELIVAFHGQFTGELSELPARLPQMKYYLTDDVELISAAGDPLNPISILDVP